MKKTVLLVIVVLAAILLSACANFDYAQTGDYIVSPKDATELIKEGTIIVDVQSPEEYALNHIEGAINIPMSSLTVKEPYPNMLPDAEQVSKVMGEAGVSEKDTILVYDNIDNMDAARVQWTLNMYSNFNVKVVSGGITALKEADVNTTSKKTVLDPVEYVAGDYQKSMIVNLEYVKSVINMPDENTVIIDTRSNKEYQEGTIPGSCHKEYVWNMYGNGEYKSPRDIQSTYLAEGIKPDTKIILFCKTSVRATQTYTALKDAGYKDVRIYDGAWVEYFDKENPEVPTKDVKPTQQDAS